MVTHYERWSDVPRHLMTATGLASLDYPRTPIEVVATVDGYDHRSKPQVYDLYDAAQSPPNRTTVGRLTPQRWQGRVCTDCGAAAQRPLVDAEPRRCPACAHIAAIRKRQALFADNRRHAIARAREILGWDRMTVVQVDVTTPPRTPSGRIRPSTAIRVQAVDAAGAQLADLTVRLVSPRAQWVPAAAVDPDVARPRLTEALSGRPLVCWSVSELYALRTHLPGVEGPRRQSAYVSGDSAAWRGMVDHRTLELIPELHPGTPDRLLLHLRRMADTPGRPS